MGFVLVGLGAILMITAFVCYILVVIKMFQNDQTGLGIGTIVGFFVCGIGHILALIFGWQNKQAWGLQKVMPIYTGALILGLAFYFAGAALVAPLVIEQQQNQMQNFQQQGIPGGNPQFNFDN